jgi:adenylate cyclase
MVTATLSLGRSPTNDVVIDDPQVSWRHALIHVEHDGTFSLIDLGSTNGTYLNERRLVLPVTMRDGDVARLGSTVLNVEMVSRRATEATAEPQPGRATLVGLEACEVTVLVADIRHYTRLAEVIRAEDLSRLVGRWFRRVGEIVDARGGVIDKFMGDAAMAHWTARRSDGAESALSAVSAAVDLQRSAVAFSEEQAAELRGQPFTIGIGVNTGSAVLGNVGTSVVPDHTVMGDTVNIAFRIEALSKKFLRPIVLGETTARYVDSRFPCTRLGSFDLEGKSEALVVFALDTPDLGRNGDPVRRSRD